MRVIGTGLKGTGLALVTLAGVSATPVRAQDWAFSVTPYLWAAGQEGTVGVLPDVPPAELDLSFGDIFEDLDGSFMVLGRASRGRFSISADLEYIRTKSTGDTPGTEYSTAEVRTKTVIASLLAGYQMTSRDNGELWADAGLRYWNVENQVNLGAGTSPAAFGKDSNTWVDPMIGLRGAYEFAPDWKLHGWAYIGGFGLGSDFMSDVFGGVGYAFNDRTELSLGWRYMTVDRRDGSFVYDIGQSGPLLGLSIMF